MVENKKIYINGVEVTEIDGKPVKYDKFGTPYVQEEQEYIDKTGNKAILMKPNYAPAEHLRISQLKLTDIMPPEAAALLPKDAKVTTLHPKVDQDKPIVIIGGYAILLNNAQEVEEITQKIMQKKLKTGPYEGYN